MYAKQKLTLLPNSSNQILIWKLTLVVLLIFTFTHLNGQTIKDEIPIKMRDEFAKCVKRNFDNGDKDFHFFIYQSFHTTGAPEIAVMIENLKLNPTEIDKILLALYRQVGSNRDWMFKNLYKWGLSANTGKYLTDYTIEYLPRD